MKWDYYIKDIPDDGDLTGWLNHSGNFGWELIQLTPLWDADDKNKPSKYQAIFKREKHENNKD